jgi:GTPase SAR1 family protein
VLGKLRLCKCLKVGGTNTQRTTSWYFNHPIPTCMFTPSFISLVRSFSNMGCFDGCIKTNGVDFVLREVQIPTTTTTVELCIHDIGGQSIFAEQRGAYMKDASFFVLVYDVSNLESFHACSKWLAEVMALQEEPIPGATNCSSSLLLAHFHSHAMSFLCIYACVSFSLCS